MDWALQRPGIEYDKWDMCKVHNWIETLDQEADGVVSWLTWEYGVDNFGGTRRRLLYLTISDPQHFSGHLGGCIINSSPSDSAASQDELAYPSGKSPCTIHRLLFFSFQERDKFPLITSISFSVWWGKVKRNRGSKSILVCAMRDLEFCSVSIFSQLSSFAVFLK